MAETLLVCNPTPYAFRGYVPFTLPVGLGRLAVRDGAGLSPVHLGDQFCPVAVRAFVRLELPPASSYALPLEPSPSDPLPPAAPKPNVVARVGGRPLDFEWSGDLELHGYARTRIGSFVAEMWLRVPPALPGEDAAPAIAWRLLLTASDPSVPDLQFYLPELAIECDDPWLVVSHDLWRDNALRETARLVLASHETFGDSQALAFSGAFVRPVEDAASWSQGEPWAVASLWSGRLGPTGARAIGSPQTKNEARERALAFRVATPRRSPWAQPPLGLSANANATGAQEDFATVGGLGALEDAAYLEMMYRSALQEACRPGNFREADGSIVLPGRHPNLVTWNHYNHWHPSVSSDRLGKGAGVPRFTGGWNGPDREHWSVNNLAAAYLLTGCPVLGELLDREARLILHGETTDPRLSTSGGGAPRGIGRTLQVAAWIVLAGPPHASMVCERIIERLAIIKAQVERVRTDAYGYAFGTIRDNRAMGDTVEAVSPWQEALGLAGLGSWILAAEARRGDMSVTLLDGLALAREVFEKVATSWLQHGWSPVEILPASAPTAEGAWQLWDYVDSQNPARRVRSEGFEEWAPGALKLCTRLLPEGPLRDRAAAILATYQPKTIKHHEWIG